jgi:hypothetical protein
MSSWTSCPTGRVGPLTGRAAAGGASAAVHRRKRLDRVLFGAAHLDQPFSMRVSGTTIRQLISPRFVSRSE